MPVKVKLEKMSNEISVHECKKPAVELAVLGIFHAKRWLASWEQ